jgi:hypothetical protein
MTKFMTNNTLRLRLQKICLIEQKRLALLKNQLYLGKKHIYFGQVIL